MLIVTARLPKKKLMAVGAGLICCCIALLAGLVCVGNVTAVSTETTSSCARNHDERMAYLEQFGWTVKDQAIAVEELLIPEKFDASYAEYLALQSSQNFDLTPYCGKRVTRYTYEITNYPTGETGVQAALLVYRNTIIGGEVLSAQPDGFLHGLEFPANAA